MSTDVADRPVGNAHRQSNYSASKLISFFFDRFAHGSLVLELPSGERIERRASIAGPEAMLQIRRWRALRKLIARGDIGFAEGYMDGDWSTPDLVKLIEWSHANEAALAGAWKGSAFARVLDRLIHHRRKNTKAGSRRNIAAHYDLGNEFYAAWLDPSMSYSSAIFSHASQTLEDAQSAKLNRVLELLAPPSGGDVLEIGCGWGALAERLISTRNCRVTGLTLSREQLDVAKRKVRSVDPNGDSEIVLRDYRDERRLYDRIVSIEMFEAAGEAYWPTYFDQLHRCLRPGGSAVLQIITIEDERFEAYRQRPDFIQRYIFPGGMLPTIQHLRSLAAGAGFKIEHVELFGQSYAQTLAHWRHAFHNAWPRLQAKFEDERFRNMWDYYLSYCQVGFQNKAIDVGLYRLVKS